MILVIRWARKARAAEVPDFWIASLGNLGE